MNAVVYARLGLRELNNNVLERRVAECVSWSVKNGMNVISVFTDSSCSGSHLDRPGFTEMCEFVIKRQLPIIILDLAQLTTSERDAALIADVFAELGIRVYSVREGLISPSELMTLERFRDDQADKSARRKFKTPRSGIALPRTSLEPRTT